ncbi:hypothetical protein LZ757_09315 [Xylella fastidiosa subsp. morus]|jgi:hypothetical protein|uniref:Uncharacterized protein n=1 Tax=Xylella fastidiosa (strain M23) TaxID=405441 RepID=B2I8M8_XYLF2|nr:hypothetical protein [Xylella fastidiosa]ACB91939.1 hypothetical protein XfasM23_0492 [Xylella fastidiosa M23]EGO81532.1 hypothetical protein XFEB_01727 [Xylella fastidiosa EB92.1]MBE0262006.1 hypothetical protein [Xylella fastidiosa subsp. fastidiosa]MBE0264017.1 hypothetical protein [Xylella fastidiosa subsp. fastidiosa]MBE0266258.1 hypothetical protein [Xylella fastidiosa subsp. fastidiosa]
MRELVMQEIRRVDGGIFFFVSPNVSSSSSFDSFPASALTPPFKHSGSNVSLFGFNFGRIVSQDFYVRSVKIYNIIQE